MMEILKSFDGVLHDGVLHDEVLHDGVLHDRVLSVQGSLGMGMGRGKEYGVGGEVQYALLENTGHGRPNIFPKASGILVYKENINRPDCSSIMCSVHFCI